MSTFVTDSGSFTGSFMGDFSRMYVDTTWDNVDYAETANLNPTNFLPQGKVSMVTGDRGRMPADFYITASSVTPQLTGKYILTFDQTGSSAVHLPTMSGSFNASTYDGTPSVVAGTSSWALVSLESTNAATTSEDFFYSGSQIVSGAFNAGHSSATSTAFQPISGSSRNVILGTNSMSYWETGSVFTFGTKWRAVKTGYYLVQFQSDFTATSTAVVETRLVVRENGSTIVYSDRQSQDESWASGTGAYLKALFVHKMESGSYLEFGIQQPTSTHRITLPSLPAANLGWNGPRMGVHYLGS